MNDISRKVWKTICIDRVRQTISSQANVPISDEFSVTQFEVREFLSRANERLKEIRSFFFSMQDRGQIFHSSTLFRGLFKYFGEFRLRECHVDAVRYWHNFRVIRPSSFKSSSKALLSIHME